MSLRLRAIRATWLALLFVAPTLLTDCGSAAPLSTGGAKAGSANAGSANVGSPSAGSPSAENGGGGTNAMCTTADCGPALGLPNHECDDGSVAGPTGLCLKRDDGACGWEVRSCPPSTGGSGGTGGAGMGGQPAGGTTSQLCGGKVCTADQACCGPLSCGHCINKLSGQYCPAQCAGGSGGTSSGGASGAGGGDCTSLLANVQSTLAKAQACNTESDKPGLECAGALEGLCCPVLVEALESTSSAVNDAYLNALHAYQKSCTHACPKIACIKPQPGNCIAASGSPLGTCGGGTGL